MTDMKNEDSYMLEINFSFVILGSIGTANCGAAIPTAVNATVATQR
jgi:hypothetical protein